MDNEAAARIARIKPADHGTRARYMQGCRCLDCRKANCTYERVRSKSKTCGLHVPNPIVPAGAARAKILALVEAGVGRRRISQLAKIPRNTIRAIADGTRLNLRQRSEAKILAIEPTLENRSGNTLIDARPYLTKLRALQVEGFTRRQIAAQLGSKARTPALQIKSAKITVRNARKIEALWRKWMTIEGLPAITHDAPGISGGDTANL